MNLGIISVRDRDYHPNRRLAEAAAEQGHRITLVHPYKVWPVLKGGKYSLAGGKDMKPPDVVLPRQGATIGDSCLSLIRHFSLMGIALVNDLESILLTKNKFLTLQALTASRIYVPETVFINAPEGFQTAVEQLGGYPVVAKQVSGRQGEGIVLVETKEDQKRVVRRHLDRRKGLLVQRFIPPGGRRDIRVMVVGGKAVGAMELRPSGGDFRANFHLSKESRLKDLSPEEEKIALKATAAVGLEIAGVDLIMDKDGMISVIEVNYSPGFKGLESATGLDIAGRIVKYVASRYAG
ncbi:MAG: RimK family alpha-L-glutamate ligase [Thermodesulfobacteriota bacterium]|nr:RimK family alpha-L-glutamate ligase [Thermodesulfobacteriota bacterium]